MTAWSRAIEIAAQTPETRNRYVDFLRAASICVVVCGHWLAAAPFMDDAGLQVGDMLHLAPWSQGLTWLLQVMPVFFIVGGYSNGASWRAAQRSGQRYGDWTLARLKRLMGPLVPLLLVWTGLAVGAHQWGVDQTMIKLGSQIAFIPTWFLAVYVMVVVTAPATHWLWCRFGTASIWGFGLGAMLVDVIAFAGGLPAVRWVNYVFVWLCVHQFGFLWRDRRIRSQTVAWSLMLGGLLLTIALVAFGPYPVSMISVPGEAVSNSRPPTLALLTLAVFHAGAVLSLERPVRRWLQARNPWAATVLVNATIMTLYLWHNTVMVLTIGSLNLLGGIGLTLRPVTLWWWIARPAWLAVLGAILLLFVAVFGRFEQTSRSLAPGPWSAWRAVPGAVAVCSGLTMLALFGIGAENALGVRVEALAVALLGTFLVLGGRPWRQPAPGVG